MEDMNVIENEETEEVIEADAASDSGNSGALVAGIVGGFIACAIIGGAKKLLTFIEKKWAMKKAAESEDGTVADAEFTVIEEEETDSSEETLEQ